MRRSAAQNSPNIGKDRSNIAAAVLAAAGAIVVIVNAVVELPLPTPTCDGLNVQVDRLGKFVQENVTALGKFPVLGLTVTLKSADCPTGTEADVGVAPIAKSKAWTGSTVNTTGAECAIAAGSLPTELTLKL